MKLTRAFSRFYTTCNFINHKSPIPKTPIAFAFDIDGVLLHSKTPIPKAIETLKYLKINKIPFILLTNGGGYTEKIRLDSLNNLLSNTNIEIDQLVQSHTPMKYLTNKFNNVLVIGGIDPFTRDAAINYGFKKVLRPIDLVKENPNIWPFVKYSKEEIDKYSISFNINEPIDAIMVFNDPRDMGTDLQIILDLLCSENGLIGTKRDYISNKPSIPIIFSNNDLLWSANYKIPRFGQGAFRIAIRELYKELNNGNELNDTVYGKPQIESYAFADKVLIDYWRKLNNLKSIGSELTFLQSYSNEYFDNVVMVGDNPKSDIAGGNNFGWETALVKTGVYKDGDFEIDRNLAKPTLGVFNDVYDAVMQSIEKVRK